MLGAAASEFEQDLPYAVWTEAIDPWLAGLDDRRRGSAWACLPRCLSELADRHALHRALRALLEGLAGARPLVLALDDLHWADGASVDAVAALVRRPPAGRVLLALAAREGQLPVPVATALAGVDREGRLTALALAPLSQDEAAALVGHDVSAIYALSGGNPFYLEAARASERDAACRYGARRGLARARGRARRARRRGRDSCSTRRRSWASVRPRVAAEAAGLDEAVALRAVDNAARAHDRASRSEPRRFAFRTRSSAKPSTRAPLRRLAARRARPRGGGRSSGGAPARPRAPTTSSSPPRPATRTRSPCSARRRARCRTGVRRRPRNSWAAALRLLPDDQTRAARRVAGRPRRGPERGRATRGARGRRCSPRSARPSRSMTSMALTVRVANAEFWLGRDEEALRRLQVALANLPAEPSRDSVRLHHSCSGSTSSRAATSRGAGARTRATRCPDAHVLGDRVLEAGVARADGDRGGGPASSPTRSGRHRAREASADSTTPRSRGACPGSGCSRGRDSWAGRVRGSRWRTSTAPREMAARQAAASGAAARGTHAVRPLRQRPPR